MNRKQLVLPIALLVTFVLLVPFVASAQTTELLNLKNSADTSVVYINDAGDVGIGTTNPATKLDVVGDIRASGTICDVNGCIGSEGADGHSLDSVNGGFPDVVFVNNEGYMGVGVTTPVKEFHVHQNAYTDQQTDIVLTNSVTGTTVNDGSTIQQWQNYLHIWNKEDGILTLGTNNTERVRIGSNGTVGIGTPAPFYKLDVNGIVRANNISASDLRWKRNVDTISDGLRTVMQLRGIIFEWAPDAPYAQDFAGVPQIGFIAQEVEQILPELVHTDDQGYKSVAYANLTAVLVEALKDQQQIIETQQAQIGELQQGREVNQASLIALQSRLTQLETVVQALATAQTREPAARLATSEKE